MEHNNCITDIENCTDWEPQDVPNQVEQTVNIRDNFFVHSQGPTKADQSNK